MPKVIETSFYDFQIFNKKILIKIFHLFHCVGLFLRLKMMAGDTEMTSTGRMRMPGDDD